MLRVSVVAALIVATLVPPVYAQSKQRLIDIQTLYSQCKGDAAQIGEDICIGYISGAGDLMKTNGQLLESGRIGDVARTFAVCGHPSNGAMQQAFENWAQKHPEHWDKEEAVGVVAALSEAWPCHSKKSN